MGLQLRRGTNAERLNITPLEGELVYTTDTQSVYVGNGITPGGVAVTVFTPEDAQDAVESLFSNGTHSGITFDYNDVTNSISATVTSTLTSLTDTGIVDPQINQILRYNGTSWVNAAADAGSSSLDSLTDVLITDATVGQVLKFNGITWVNSAEEQPGASTLDALTDVGIVNPQEGQFLKYNGTSWVNQTNIDAGILTVEEDTTPTLGGDLTLNGFSVTGSGNIDISGSATVTSLLTNSISGGDSFITIESNQKPALRIKSVTDGTLVGLPFLEISVSNGTLLSPTDTLAGNLLTGIKFTAYNEATAKFSGSITSQWDPAATMANDFPGSILTISAGDNNTGFKSATFTGVTGAFAAPVLQTGVYTTTPDTRPASPTKGMIIFNDTAGQFEGWNGTTWVTLG